MGVTMDDTAEDQPDAETQIGQHASGHTEHDRRDLLQQLRAEHADMTEADLQLTPLSDWHEMRGIVSCILIVVAGGLVGTAALFGPMLLR
jgi:hypothetical protein